MQLFSATAYHMMTAGIGHKRLPETICGFPTMLTTKNSDRRYHLNSVFTTCPEAKEEQDFLNIDRDASIVPKTIDGTKHYGVYVRFRV